MHSIKKPITKKTTPNLFRAYVPNYTPMNDKEEKEDEQPPIEERPYYVYEGKHVQRVYHFYISGMIDEPFKYVDMIHRLQDAREGDIVFIHLNTMGGYVDTGVQLINAMQTSAAHVITSLEGQAASMGALMFLAGDEYIIHDDCLLMIHNYSGGAWGKGHELLANAQGVNRWIEKFFRKLTVPFLTEDEFQTVVDGKDFWIDSDEVRKRLKAMAKAMEDDLVQKEIQKEERKIKRMEREIAKLKEEEKQLKEAETNTTKKPTRKRAPKKVKEETTEE